VICEESQGLSAQAVLEGGSCLPLLLGKTFRIVSVVMKDLLCFIRLKSLWAVVYNGEQKRKALEIISRNRTSCLILFFFWLLAAKATAGSGVVCLVLTRRRCKSGLMRSYLSIKQQRVD